MRIYDAPNKMKAVVLHGKNDFDVELVDVPDIKDDEVLCKVEAVFICGTDPHIFRGEYEGFWPRSFPFIPGHEWSGTIVKAGRIATSLNYNAGDRICSISHCGCGYCEMCLEGRYNLCLNYGSDEVGHRQYGHITQGAYAQYIAVSVKSIYKVPANIPLRVAACIDPLSIALHTLERSKFRAGDDIVIMGTGPQGLMGLLLAKSLGAGNIYAVGSGSRLDRAIDLGAIGLNYRNENVVQKIMELTKGKGVRRVLECAGTSISLKNACEVASVGGVISVIGLPNDDISLPIKKIVLEEIEIIGNRANPNTAARSISLISQGRLDIESLITHYFSIDDFKEGYSIFDNRLDGSIKVGILPNG